MTEPQADPSTLELRHVSKSYGNSVALQDVSFEVVRGEIVTLLGPSGSGKSTLLNLIAGFSSPSGGSILLGGRDVLRLHPALRGIGMVFQDYALFPHMTVGDNIAYGLKMRRWPRERRDQRVSEMLDLVNLAGVAARRPHELSGGQRQRVSIARALAFQPSLLLMDEPLGALDRELRSYMAAEIRRIHRELQVTILYVTHDQEEAMSISDRIAILRAGRLQAIDSPRNLYTRPPSTFVATFLGNHNLFAGTLVENDGPDTAHGVLNGAEVRLRLGGNGGRKAWLVVRPTQLMLERREGSLTFEAEVADIVYLGDVVHLTCRTNRAQNGTVVATVPLGSELPVVGSNVWLSIRPDQGFAVCSDGASDNAGS